MTQHYYGNRWWYVRIPGMAPDWWDRLVELKLPSENEREDERHVRFLVRKELGLKRLPIGTQVWPKTF